MLRRVCTLLRGVLRAARALVAYESSAYRPRSAARASRGGVGVCSHAGRPSAELDALSRSGTPGRGRVRWCWRKPAEAAGKCLLRAASARLIGAGRPEFGYTSRMNKLQLGDAERREAESHVRALLRLIGEDPDRQGLRDTPARYVRALEEQFVGYTQDPKQFLERTFDEVQGYDEMVLVSDIEVYSHCEHHLVPFVGKAHVGYIPNGRVVGLSKLARVVDVFAKRLQVQEKLTVQIAQAIEETLAPQGVAVIIQCQHFCMCYRGVRKPGSWTTTSRLRGVFLQDPAARLELLTLLGLKRGIGSSGGD
jgi:GTP cyclohydrolase IA